MSKRKAELDEVGYWSEVKLEILRKYAGVYSRILAHSKRAKAAGLKHYYIDGFAGAGEHISKASGELIPGSPLNALHITPPFLHHFLIDLSGKRVERLRKLIGERGDVTLLKGDCNEVLLEHVLPHVRYERRERALCLLDPYGLHLTWEVLAAIGRSKSIDLFLNFSVMDANMNAIPSQQSRAKPEQVARMTAFWGDDSWRSVAYRPKSQTNLFGDAGMEKTTNDHLVGALRERLRDVAGFKFVPEPMPMRNNTNAIVYYLFFASHNDIGAKVFGEISRKYRDHHPAMSAPRP